jgi:hypothetical protein
MSRNLVIHCCHWIEEHLKLKILQLQGTKALKTKLIKKTLMLLFSIVGQTFLSFWVWEIIWSSNYMQLFLESIQIHLTYLYMQLPSFK